MIFDIGANIGQYAIPLSGFVGNEGRIYSFEPDYKNFAFLKFNSIINLCYNITCLNYGVGNEDKEQIFYRDTETGGRMGSFIKSYVGKSFRGLQITQQIKKIDSLIIKYGEPDFIKVDVEGFEIEVILGLTIDLKDTTWLVEVRESTKDMVFDYFEKQSYTCINLDNSNILIKTSNEIPRFANLLFTKA